ncbi:MAG: hypothetical protein PF489_03255 [Salinivirgaceae bacterium]|nr:hypothetical protein [Salinivirgaceae bacterium]
MLAFLRILALESTLSGANVLRVRKRNNDVTFILITTTYERMHLNYQDKSAPDYRKEACS